MEDAAVVPGDATIAMTTDSFVVTPLEFPGGDIGLLLMGSQKFAAEIWNRNTEASWPSLSHLQSE